MRGSQPETHANNHRHLVAVRSCTPAPSGTPAQWTTWAASQAASQRRGSRQRRPRVAYFQSDAAPRPPFATRVCDGGCLVRMAASTSALPTVETLVRQRKIRDSHKTGSDEKATVPRKVPAVIQHTPKVLVLDLDETLIHSRLGSGSLWNRWQTSDHVATWLLDGWMNMLGLGSGIPSHARLQIRGIEVHMDGRRVCYQVYKRPWVDYFLRKVASWYHVVIFTA